MSDCIFCKIISGELPSHRVYEDDIVLAFLDINPVNPGHTLVIPKQHFADLSDLPEAIAHAMLSVVQKIAPSILSAVESGGYNLGVNNGVAAGQVVFHSHFHIMPRFENDGHALWKGKDMGQDNLRDLAEKIRGCL